MGSPIVGRTTCPECGFESAHVKQSEKCLYRYCPECGSQHHAKSQRQRDDLMAKTRKMAEATPTPTPTPEATKDDDAPAPAAEATPTPTPPTQPRPAPARRSGLFGVGL